MSMDIKVKYKITDNKYNATFEGKDINYIIVNTIRRVILSLVPVYSFAPDNIDIKANDSIYNNDILRLRICNLPVYNIKNNETTLKHIERLKQKTPIDEDSTLPKLEEITMYCGVTNTSEDVMNVTTDMCKFYNIDSEIKNIYKNPLLLCKLKKDESLTLTAKTGLGIGLINSLWSAVSICCYEEINDHKFDFKFETDGQLTSPEIISRAIKIIINQLTRYRDLITKDKLGDMGEIILNNEAHTMGNILAMGLQNHKNIDYAGYKINHLLVRKATIKYIANGGKPMNTIIRDSIDNTIKIYEKILKLV
jgi:DNA-directed RNA polymerase subunit L